MTEQEEIEKALCEAFHLMYDGLPEPTAPLAEIETAIRLELAK